MPPTSQPSSPIPLPIVVIHFDTDESDPEELSVPIITDIRTVTTMTNSSSPICILDTETNQSLITGPPPMKKFRVTLGPPPLLKNVHQQVYPPSVMIPPGTPLNTGTTLLIMDHQPLTSTADLQTTMAQIESVWEARMDAHITDKLAEHDFSIATKFAAHDKNSKNQFTALEMLLGSRFEEMETALKTKTDSIEYYVNIKMAAIESAMIVKVDAVETKLTNMVTLISQIWTVASDSNYYCPFKD